MLSPQWVAPEVSPRSCTLDCCVGVVFTVAAIYCCSCTLPHPMIPSQSIFPVGPLNDNLDNWLNSCPNHLKKYAGT